MLALFNHQSWKLFSSIPYNLKFYLWEQRLYMYFWSSMEFPFGLQELNIVV